MHARAELAPRWLWIVAGIACVPMLALALSPPIQFDETLYHLPTLEAIVRDGIGFHEDLRFPVFPILGDLLALPFYLAGGAPATHLVSLLAMLLTFFVMLLWARRRGIANGQLAAAMFLGAPIVVHLATSFYVEMPLTLFVTLGFSFLDREADERRFLKAGLAFGAACSVKYLGLYFIAVALLWLKRKRDFAPFALGAAITALPTYAWIFAESGNPFFPFFGSSPWHLPLPPTPSFGEWLVKLVRLPWDIVFARERIGMQPPFAPLFGVAMLILLVRRPSRVTWIAAGFIIAFTFLPPDCRYLVPLLPLVLIEAADRIPTLPRRVMAALVVLAVLPGPAYAIYRIVKHGPREGFVERNLPAVRALHRADPSMRVYNCGGENLLAYAPGVYLGDHAGLHSYLRLLGSGRDAAFMHANLTAERFDALLVVKKRCNFLALPAPGFTLMYEDDAAQLWRIDP